MLKLNIPEIELFNEETNEFINFKSQQISMEHSLVSISKWESKWHKPFLKKDYVMTNEELIDYLKCMTLTQNVDPDIYQYFPQDIVNKIVEYVNDPMTATWFNERKSAQTKRTGEIITSELIYYWMVANNIPFETQKWHINRLLTLIRICSIKNSPPKKMGKNEQMRMQTELNNKRRAALHTKG